jgi:DHA1 family inner membrane transport protein
MISDHPQQPSIFPFSEIASIVALGIGGTIITILQPVLLGAMVHSGRLTAAQLGYAATAELAAMGLGVTLAGARFRPQRLRLIALAAVLVLMAGNLATVFASGSGIIAARFFAGCGSGIMLWLVIGLAVRVASPERLIGTYAAVQAVLGLALSALCGQILVPRVGGSGAFACLLVINLAMVAVCASAPRAYAPLPKAAAASPLLPPRAWLGLAAAGAFQAGLISLWVYVPVLLNGAGVPQAIASDTIDASLACQILGGLIAAAAGKRLGYMAVLSASALGAITSGVLLALPMQFIVYVAAGGLFGLVWIVGFSYQVPFLIAADPSRRAAMFVNPAQLVGMTLGPLIASLTVSQTARGPAAVSIAFFVLSLLLYWGVYLRGAHQQAGQGVLPPGPPLKARP